MPDKEGSEDNKSTKSVVNKKQKQMMGEEGYDIARDMGKVSPSKDKKDATTMPVSNEVKKTQKKSKGPSAFELVKAKYGKSVMNGKKKANEELDLTKVAEAFGGYIVEANGDKNDKKQKPTQKDLSAAADKRKKEQIQQQQRANDPRQPGMDDEEGQGVGFSPRQQASVTKTLQNIASKPKETAQRVKGTAKGQDALMKAIQTGKTKSGEDAAVVGRETRFKQSFGTPTGADPKTGKPTYAPSRVETPKPGKAKSQISFGPGVEPVTLYSPDRIQKRLAPDMDMPKGKGGAAPTGDQYSAASKKLGDREARKSDRLDPKTGKASSKGITSFITKARQMRSGSNEPVDQKSVAMQKEIDGPRVERQINRDLSGRRAKIQRDPSVKVQTAADVQSDLQKGEAAAKKRDKSELLKRSPTQIASNPTSAVGRTGGLIAKTILPATAGLEAMQRYKKGDKVGATISAIQAIGGPIGFGAGVVNALRKSPSGAQLVSPDAATKEPSKKTVVSDTERKKIEKRVSSGVSGDGGGKKPPRNITKTMPPSDGGGEVPAKDAVPVPAGDTAGTELGTGIAYQQFKDAGDSVRKGLGKILNPKNLQTKKRTKTGRRSAG